MHTFHTNHPIKIKTFCAQRRRLVVDFKTFVFENLWLQGKQENETPLTLRWRRPVWDSTFRVGGTPQVAPCRSLQLPQEMRKHTVDNCEMKWFHPFIAENYKSVPLSCQIQISLQMINPTLSVSQKNFPPFSYCLHSQLPFEGPSSRVLVVKRFLAHRGTLSCCSHKFE